MADDNAAMIAHWDGPVGQQWVDEQERYERMNARFGVRLLDAANLRPGQRFLDVGCGHGARTLDIARLVGPDGSATGVDVSGPMLAIARRRAAEQAVRNASFVRADAQIDDLGGPFDGIVSQFGVMFFADPAAAFTNVRQALRPGGRLAFVCWQELGLQQRIMIPTLAALEHIPLPEIDVDNWAAAAFSLADPATVDRILTTAGFVDIAFAPVTEPEYQGRDLDDTIAFLKRSEFASMLFTAADDTAAATAWAAIARALEPHLTDDGVHLNGAAWLVTAAADR